MFLALLGIIFRIAVIKSCYITPREIMYWVIWLLEYWFVYRIYYIHTHTHTHLHIRTYIYIYIYTCIYSLLLPLSNTNTIHTHTHTRIYTKEGNISFPNHMIQTKTYFLLDLSLRRGAIQATYRRQEKQTIWRATADSLINKLNYFLYEMREGVWARESLDICSALTVETWLVRLTVEGRQFSK